VKLIFIDFCGQAQPFIAGFWARGYCLTFMTVNDHIRHIYDL
jgi:hypothetical protein